MKGRFVLTNDLGSVIFSTPSKDEALRLKKLLGHDVTFVPTEDMVYAELMAKLAYYDRQGEGEWQTLH